MSADASAAARQLAADQTSVRSERKTRLRVVPIPDCNPTSRAEDVRASPVEGGQGWEQAALDLVYTLPSGRPAVPAAPRNLRILGRSHPGDTVPGDAQAWAARFVPALVEVLAGERPLSQLVRWTERSVYDEIRDLVERRSLTSGSAGARRSSMAVRSIHLCEPHAGAAEISAVLRVGRRAKAIALRLDVVDGRWRCTQMLLV